MTNIVLPDKQQTLAVINRSACIILDETLEKVSLNNLPKYEVGDKKEMANINGLFDAAKMFELFAIEVCNVWFEQKFSKEAM